MTTIKEMTSVEYELDYKSLQLLETGLSETK
jgi:hypothetical protein